VFRSVFVLHTDSRPKNSTETLVRSASDSGTSS
jgi:hypothetical protein